MHRWQNKVAVITGAASGIGKELACHAAKMGMRLLLADVQAAELEQTVQDCRALYAHNQNPSPVLSAATDAASASVLGRCCDVTQAAEVEALAELAYTHFGMVHLVCNNAGVAGGGLLWEYSEADWQWLLGTNLWGAIHGIRAFVPRMLATARQDPTYQGQMLNTASMAGLVNPPLMGAYNVSKHALVSLTESLHQDLMLVSEQVRCAVLCPYHVQTGILVSMPPHAQSISGLAGRQLAGAMAARAMRESRVSAVDVACMVFEGLDAGHFYLYSHPHALEPVHERMEDVLAARAPRPCFVTQPETQQWLKQGLQSPS